MATKATTTKTSTKKSTAAIDPFEAVVETAATGTVKAESKVKTPRKTVKKAVTVAAFDSIAAEPTTSPVKKRATKTADTTGATPKTKRAVSAKKTGTDATVELAADKPEVEMSPVFKTLANVELPQLDRENRARLLMQSPTKLYFYWSIKGNPWQQLSSVFGDDLGSYTLVLKLKDIKHDGEQINRVDAEGNWWFDVDADGEYQAEIGFYAPNRPYFRVVYSNTITTPRRSPSPRPASDAKWTVSADKFAEVLDVAGFTRDAYDVAMAGDDHAAAESTAHTAFRSFIANEARGFETVSAEDIRYALLAIAAGFTLEELRSRVSPKLFAILQAHTAKVDAALAQAALSEHFDIDEAEFTEEEFGSAIYGASLVHFPKTLKTKKLSPKYSPRYNPVSSHSIR